MLPHFALVLWNTLKPREPLKLTFWVLLSLHRRCWTWKSSEPHQASDSQRSPPILLTFGSDSWTLFSELLGPTPPASFSFSVFSSGVRLQNPLSLMRIAPSTKYPPTQIFNIQSCLIEHLNVLWSPWRCPQGFLPGGLDPHTQSDRQWSTLSVYCVTTDTFRV